MCAGARRFQSRCRRTGNQKLSFDRISRRVTGDQTIAVVAWHGLLALSESSGIVASASRSIRVMSQRPDDSRGLMTVPPLRPALFGLDIRQVPADRQPCPCQAQQRPAEHHAEQAQRVDHGE